MKTASILTIGCAAMALSITSCTNFGSPNTYNLNEIGGAVGLTEFNLMTHGLHVDRQLIRLLSQFIGRSFCFFFFHSNCNS